MKSKTLIVALLVNFTIAFQSDTFADTFTTAGSGDWLDASNWASGNVPQGSSSDPDMRLDHDITLNGSIRFTQNNPRINLSSGVVFIVTETIEFDKKLSLSIPSGAQMIIMGDFIASEGISGNLNGDLIVLGDFMAGDNTDLNINGDGNLVAIGEYQAGTGNFNGSGSVYVLDNDPVCATSGDDCGGAISNFYTTMSDLETYAPDIHDIVNGALPVTFLYFKAEVHNRQALMTWATEREENFNYFIMERSDDGSSFREIGKLEGNGWSRETREYAFTDKNPMSGVNYYRLKAVDYDGYTEYFNIISIFMEHSNAKADALVKNHRLQLRNVDDAQVRILNPIGATVFRETVNTGNASFDLPETVSKGYYILFIYTAEKVLARERIYVD